MKPESVVEPDVKEWMEDTVIRYAILGNLNTPYSVLTLMECACSVLRDMFYVMRHREVLGTNKMGAWHDRDGAVMYILYDDAIYRRFGDVSTSTVKNKSRAIAAYKRVTKSRRTAMKAMITILDRQINAFRIKR